MITKSVAAAVAAMAVVVAGPAQAAMPPMPPMTSGNGDGGMKHISVGLSATAVSAHVAEPPAEVAPASPVRMSSGHSADFTPAKFDVLEGVYFNAQFGWLPGVFDVAPGVDEAIWIERTGATQPAGSTFRVFEAGRGPLLPPGDPNETEGPALWTMNEIYAIDGDRWQWDGVMQHDYYTADMPGNYAMSFRVYVGDLAGNANGSFAPATATLRFQVAPEPGAWALASLAVLGLAWRRRR